jgi:hypothetical protein
MLMEIMLTCPRLRELDHCDFYEKHEAHKRITINRTGEEGEKFSYTVTKPLPRYDFLCDKYHTFPNSHIVEIHLTSLMEPLTDATPSRDSQSSPPRGGAAFALIAARYSFNFIKSPRMALLFIPIAV